MTFDEYKDLAMRTNDGKCNERLLRKSDYTSFNIGEVLNASLGISGETGELNDMIKKWIFHGHSLSFDSVKKEISDCFWYLALMCHAFGFSMDEIAELNIEKLKKRYPEGFSEYASQHRQAGDD